LIAWWPHTTDRSVASFRLRCLQVIQALRDRGVDSRLWAPGVTMPSVLVLSKRYDQESMERALAMRRAAGTRLVLDLCDNHFYAANDDPRWRRRALALREAVLTVDLVTTASAELARIVAEHAGERTPVEVIEDAVELPSRPAGLQWLAHPIAHAALVSLQRRLERDAPATRLVWFGNHGSPYADGGMEDLLRVRESLHAAHSAQPLSLTVVSNSRRRFRTLLEDWRLPVHYLPWHPMTFSSALGLHDVAVIPIGRNPFTLCKTNNRVATALLHGLAVVADSIPSYEPLRDCCVLDDWGDGLRQRLANAAARELAVTRGRERIEARWSLQAVSTRWLDVIGGLRPVRVGRGAASRAP
jgi:hypothetical protein